MIIPGALMGVTDYVYVAGVAANPDSITAVLYRWVGSTRSASGITVTCTSVGSGEYRFTWTNDAGFARTDELELVALPVVSGVTYPATVWRSHGSVDAVVPTAAAGAIGGLLTAPTTANTGLADVTRLLGTAWLTPGTAGTPDVNLTTTALGAIWNRLTSSMTTASSIGKKLADWVLGSDNKAMLSSDAQTGVVLPRVTLVDTTTTNTDMRGTDSAALAATALSTAQWTNTLATNLGTTNTTVATNLDAAISSRMATYTQPTGFLAATFPGTVASTTNITAASGVVLSSAGVRAIWTDDWYQVAFSADTPGGYVQAMATDIDGLVTTSAAVQDRVSYCLTVLVGACSDAGTSAETYVHAIGGETFTVDFTGLDATGNRTTTTLSKV